MPLKGKIVREEIMRKGARSVWCMLLLLTSLCFRFGGKEKREKARREEEERGRVVLR